MFFLLFLQRIVSPIFRSNSTSMLLRRSKHPSYLFVFFILLSLQSSSISSSSSSSAFLFNGPQSKYTIPSNNVIDEGTVVKKSQQLLAPPPPPKDVQILILPGFGHGYQDYISTKDNDDSLASAFYKRGWCKDQIHVLPIKRSDWMKVFVNGLFDIKFWLGTVSPTDPSYRWYLQHIVDKVKELSSTSQSLSSNHKDNTDSNSKIVLVGHSAGGWLARAAMGFDIVSPSSNSNNYLSQREKEIVSDVMNINNNPDIITSNHNRLQPVVGLVTLGTPHLPPPQNVSIDLTRGALRHTDEKFPGAYHQQNGVFYVTVASDTVHGQKKQKQKINHPIVNNGNNHHKSIEHFAYDSYDIVCGNGFVKGDGIVPLHCGHLENARQLNLQGVFHTKLATLKDEHHWYGSEAVIDHWYEAFLEETHRHIYNRKKNKIKK